MSWYISEDVTIQRDSFEMKKIRDFAHFIYFLKHLKFFSWKINGICISIIFQLSLAGLVNHHVTSCEMSGKRVHCHENYQLKQNH